MKVGRLCSTQHISFGKIESNIKSVDMNTLYTKKEISAITDTFETITPLSSTKYTYSKTYYPDTKTIILNNISSKSHSIIVDNKGNATLYGCWHKRESKENYKELIDKTQIKFEAGQLSSDQVIKWPRCF